MHALVYTAKQTIVYREEKNPIEKDGESILKIKASGICGSDMHAYHGKDERRIPPLILGHEISGIIQNGKLKNKNAVLNPLLTCGNCNYCKNGREHLCGKRVLLGMSKPIKREGGFAEYVSIPDKNIYEIPKELNIEEFAVAEPTAVSLHAVLLGQNTLNKSLSECKILIQGCGAIGLICGLILSYEKNCKNIVMSDPNKLRSDECAKYLKAEFINPKEKKLKENEFDIVFDTVGSEITRQQAIFVVAPGGSIVHIGLHEPTGSFDFRKLTLREITLVGTYCYTNNDFEKTIDILANKKIGPLNWIDYRDLKKGPEAFKEIHEGKCASPKIILKP